jgi:hypothetical protein
MVGFEILGPRTGRGERPDLMAVTKHIWLGTIASTEKLAKAPRRRLCAMGLVRGGDPIISWAGKLARRIARVHS